MRQQCYKEHRIGETCGLKLIHSAEPMSTTCKRCDAIEKKERRIVKLSSNLMRWRAQGNVPATVEIGQKELYKLWFTIAVLVELHSPRELLPLANRGLGGNTLPPLYCSTAQRHDLERSRPERQSNPEGLYLATT